MVKEIEVFSNTNELGWMTNDDGKQEIVRIVPSTM